MDFFAINNLEDMRLSNTYPGRGMIVGLSEKVDVMVQVYWIMGRKDVSRNRVFSSDGGRVFTEVADPSKMPSEAERKLVIYNAMMEWSLLGSPTHFVVSNGAQTDAVALAIAHGKTIYDELQSWSYEPDAPNYTPRITAVCALNKNPHIVMSSLWRSSRHGSCQRDFYAWDDLAPGLGHCLMTYEGDGDPLPSYTGRPYLLPLEGNAADIADTYWCPQAAYAPNLVSLVVKTIDCRSGRSEVLIRNRFNKV